MSKSKQTKIAEESGTRRIAMPRGMLSTKRMVTRLRCLAHGSAMESRICTYQEAAALVHLERGEKIDVLRNALNRLMEEDHEVRGAPFYASLFVSRDPKWAQLNGGHFLPDNNFFAMASQIRGIKIRDKVKFWQAEVRACFKSMGGDPSKMYGEVFEDLTDGDVQAVSLEETPVAEDLPKATPDAIERLASKTNSKRVSCGTKVPFLA